VPDAATSAVPPPGFVPGTFEPLAAPSDGLNLIGFDSYGRTL
jgi:hypothetical protein